METMRLVIDIDRGFNGMWIACVHVSGRGYGGMRFKVKDGLSREDAMDKALIRLYHIYACGVKERGGKSNLNGKIG